MNQFQLTISSQGCCLFCLNSYPDVTNFNDSSETNVDNNGKLTSILSFKLIMRYLGVDIFKICKSSEEPEIPLCDKCGILVNNFLGWYQDSEMIRLFLLNAIQGLHDVIKQRRKLDKQILDEVITDGSGDASNMVTNLRKKILRKCSLKLVSTPKILANRTENTDHVDFDHIGVQDSRVCNSLKNREKSLHQMSDIVTIKVEAACEDEVENTSAQDTPWSGKSVDIKVEPDLTSFEDLKSSHSHDLCPAIIEEPMNEENDTNSPPSSTQQDCSRVCLICWEISECHLKTDKMSILPFKVFTRFLGIDYSNILKCSKDLDQLENEIIFCDKCLSRLNQFLQLYEDFESTRLFIDNCIHTMIDRMMSTPPDIVVKSSVIINLRKEIFKTCSRKLFSIPRVSLKRVEMHDIITTTGKEAVSAPSIPKNYDDNDNELVNNEVDEIDVDVKMEPFESSQSLHDKDTPSKKTQPTNKKRRKAPSALKKPSNLEGRVECKFCQKSFSGHPQTNLHMSVVHTYHLYSNRVPSSSISEEKFTKIFLKILTLGKRYGNRKIGCPYCVKCTRDDLLKSHILDYHLEKVKLAIEDPSKLPRGTQTVHIVKENAGLDFKCSKCGMKLCSETTYRRHMNKHLGSFSCKFCKLKCSSAYHLKSHELTLHTMARLKKELPSGTKETKLDTVLQNIMSQQEPLPGGKISCVLCKKQFYPENRLLKAHLLMSHLKTVIAKLEGEDEGERCSGSKKIFTCVKCRKSFESGKKLSLHQKKSEDCSYFECLHCGKVCTSEVTRRKHIVSFHPLQHLGDNAPPGTTEKTVKKVIKNLMPKEKSRYREIVKCTVCEKEILDKSALRNHILLIHEEIVKHKLWKMKEAKRKKAPKNNSSQLANDKEELASVE